MATVYLRDFPEDLHRKAKAEAALAGITMKEFIIRAMIEYLKQKKKRTGGSITILANQPMGKPIPEDDKINGTDSLASNPGDHILESLKTFQSEIILVIILFNKKIIYNIYT